MLYEAQSEYIFCYPGLDAPASMSDRVDELRAGLADGAATVASMLKARAASSPDSTAFTFWSSGQLVDSLTFKQLHVAACAVAEQLVDRDCGGHSVILVHPPGLDFLVDLFGCLYAGAAAVPLPAPVRERDFNRFERVAHLIEPKAVVVPTGGIADKLLERWSETWPDLSFHKSTRRETTWTPRVDVHGDDTAVVQFTSGSSSSPRGAILSHTSIMANLSQIQRAFDFRSAERHEAVLLWLPHYHDMGLFGRLECLCAGCPGHIMSPLEFTRRPMRWLELATKTRATVTGAPNFAFDLCADLAEAGESGALDLSALRIAFCGAEPINAKTLDRFEIAFRRFGLSPTAVLPCYGLAEATLIVSSQVPGRNRRVVTVDTHALEQGRLRCARSEPGRPIVSCGQVVSGMQVAIVDPATRCEMPPDTVGEIWISGPSVIREQFGDRGRQSVLASMADRHAGRPRYFPTGDLGGYIDGELFIVGRISNTIIVHGRNLHPHDLERVVPDCHPALRFSRTAAVAAATANGERVALIVEVRRDVEQRTSELIEAANAVAAEIRRQFDTDPDRIVLVRRGAISWTTSGKIAYGETASRFHRGQLDVLTSWPDAPRTRGKGPEGVEDAILDVIRSVLRRDVKPDTGFYDIGGDSLAAHRVAARLRRIFGPAFVEHELVLDLPISEIARLVDRRLGEYVEDLSEQEAADALLVIEASTPQDVVRLPAARREVSAAEHSSHG
jgi:acyl-CoA synthetase (AMP-forming)/AMP-acid ligase II